MVVVVVVDMVVVNAVAAYAVRSFMGVLQMVFVHVAIGAELTWLDLIRRLHRL